MVRPAHSGGTATFRRCFSRLIFRAFGLVPGKQSLKIVTIWAVAAEGILVEQTLDSTGRTNLIGTTLGADRPTHLAVPTAPENHSSARQACGKQAHGPQPSTTTPHFRRFLVFFFHHCLTLRVPIPSIFRFAGRSNADVRTMRTGSSQRYHPPFQSVASNRAGQQASP